MIATDRLVAWLRERFDDPSLGILRDERLSGGAIQQNVALDLSLEDGARSLALVLRTDAASGVSVSHSREHEHALLAAAFAAGVTVPEPLGLCLDTSVTGRPFFLMERVEGSANPVRLTRDDALDGTAGERLVEALGGELARIHAVPLDDPQLAFLSAAAARGAGASSTSGSDGSDGSNGSNVLAARVALYRSLLDELGACRPVLEWTLAWLSRQRIAPQPPRLCHNDFRTGNLMIDEAGHVTGVLDWEFAAPGDPHEDIGWFCAPCWRFAARERDAGGLGSRKAFYAGYETASGRTIDRAAVPIWEIVATVRWAVIALQQGARFTSGAEPTLELGLTGRMIAGLEQDLLGLVTRAADQLLPMESTTDQPLPTASVSGHPLPTASDGTSPAEGGDRSPAAPDEPTGEALLAAARTALLDELLPALPDDRRYTARMIANAMGIAIRELDRRGDVRAEATSSLGPAFRRGDVDDLLDPTLLARLCADVDARLALDDPRRLRR